MQNIAKQIHQQLLNARKILIVPHQNPDGDALGSAGAMTEYLQRLGKELVVFCGTAVPARWHFIPHALTVSQDKNHFTDNKIDVIVVLDSGDLRYAGIEKLAANHPAMIINIDHHITNEKYGVHNLVIPSSSSTAETLYHYFRHNRIVINATMATALLTGIITDTDNFSNSATNTSSMLAAGELLRAGGNLKMIINKTVKDKTLPALKIWGAALARLTKIEDHDIAYTYITRQDLIDYNVTESEADGVANFLNTLSDGKISLIMKETADGQIKGSLRTTNADTDVAAIAKRLGGGGHKKAAGFTIPGTIEEVLKKVLQK